MGTVPDGDVGVDREGHQPQAERGTGGDRDAREGELGIGRGEGGVGKGIVREQEARIDRCRSGPTKEVGVGERRGRSPGELDPRGGREHKFEVEAGHVVGFGIGVREVNLESAGSRGRPLDINDAHEEIGAGRNRAENEGGQSTR